MNIQAFLLTTLAGMATLIGGLIILLKRKNNYIISFSLSFASGVMIYVSIIDLIPSSLKAFKDYIILINFALIFLFFFIGILISNTINKIGNKTFKSSKLFKLGIISMIAIILHNIPEGITTYLTSNQNIKLGITLVIAIALHNIPEGITIALPIYYDTSSKFKALFFTLLAALSEPLGAIIAHIFLSNIVNDFIMGILYSIIAGIMINISIEELMKESYKQSKKGFLVGLIFGVSFMLLNHFIFG